jgi:hypothetical protein
VKIPLIHVEKMLVIDKQGMLLKPSCSFKVKASNNYLALRNMTGHYYLNGNWRIDFPQQIEMAGKNSKELVLCIRIWIRRIRTYVFGPPGSAFGSVCHSTDPAPDPSIIKQRL